MSLEQLTKGLYYDTYDEVFVCDAKELCEAAGWTVTQENMATLYAMVKQNLPVLAEELGIDSRELILVEQPAPSALVGANDTGDIPDGTQSESSTDRSETDR